jgi:hypothetical protein
MISTDTRFTEQHRKPVPVKFILLLWILLSNADGLLAQNTFYPAPPVDSTANIPLRERPIKKRFGRAAFQLGLAEAIPFIFDRYVRKADFAKIDFQSVGYNLNPKSWTWDDDDFGTNQFAHPYHGSLYYNSFRSNGYSFWQSVPYVFAGSYIWETFAEKQYPSPNDFINTSFGGIILGEMTHRLSNKIVNNRRRGFRRQVNEVFALLINPMNGLNRIIDGQWGKIMRNTRERDSSKIYAEFDLGQRKFNTANKLPPRYGWYGRIKFLYGNAFENYRKPFSNISVTTEFGRDDSSKVNVVSVHGSLAGWEIASTDSFKHYAILSANYDYIHNEAFFYSAQSIKLNILSSFGLMRHVKINTTLGLGAVILAAIPDGYKFGRRVYDYGSGFNIDASAGLSIANRFYYGISYRGGVIKTVNGNRSHYFLHGVTSEIRYMFIKNLSACVEPGYFTLIGHYKDFPDVNHKYPYLRFSLRYHLTSSN